MGKNQGNDQLVEDGYVSRALLYFDETFNRINAVIAGFFAATNDINNAAAAGDGRNTAGHKTCATGHGGADAVAAVGVCRVQRAKEETVETAAATAQGLRNSVIFLGFCRQIHQIADDSFAVRLYRLTAKNIRYRRNGSPNDDDG